MAGIKILTPEILKIASDIKKSEGRLSNNISVFSNVENDINDAWKSRYTADYIACLEADKKELVRICDGLEKIANELNGIAFAVEESERNLHDLFNKQGGQSGGSGGGGGGSW